jgi:hypothetical protein
MVSHEIAEGPLRIFNIHMGTVNLQDLITCISETKLIKRKTYQDKKQSLHIPIPRNRV